MVETVLVTSRLQPPGDETLPVDDFDIHDFNRCDDKEKLLAKFGEKTTGVFCSGSSGTLDCDLMDRLPNLKIISVMGVGYNTVDVAAAKKRGIMVSNTPGVLTDCVADIGMALMLAISRGVVIGDDYTRSGGWVKNGTMAYTTKVSGKRLGIIGFGRIGQAVGKRAEAFDMKVSYQGPNHKDIPNDYYAEPTELASNVDFLMLTCPGGPGTEKLVNAKVLEALGPSGMLINIARGSVVDERALASALKNNVIAGAALDVFENEPSAPEDLIGLKNVIVQPHHASATNETRQAMADLMVENLQLFFSGKPVKTPVPEMD
ncbi:MAG: hydroxyacid dehydrogenase [Rhodospirillaceae bacterium]|nr:hydroxyacid dehydrogenase [Rhodospirillaceae bacterium]|tara:strand:- start:561 stop:1514 length:954 start_codon:yes stop_codon:yes gene_type:complete